MPVKGRTPVEVRADAGTSAGTEAVPWRSRESRAVSSRAMRLSMEHYHFKKLPTFVQCLGCDLSVVAECEVTAVTGSETAFSANECRGYKPFTATDPE